MPRPKAVQAELYESCVPNVVLKKNHSKNKPYVKIRQEMHMYKSGVNIHSMYKNHMEK